MCSQLYGKIMGSIDSGKIKSETDRRNNCLIESMFDKIRDL